MNRALRWALPALLCGVMAACGGSVVPNAAATAQPVIEITPLPGQNIAATAAALEQNAPALAGSYTVQPGDTLTDIAARFNMRVDDLAALNNITDPNAIQVGQTLLVPLLGPTPSAAASPSPVAPPADATAPPVYP